MRKLKIKLLEVFIMKKVLGMILFICAAGIGYCAGIVRGCIYSAQCCTERPEAWTKGSKAIYDSIENVKDTFKK
jgi:hypothetical protein